MAIKQSIMITQSVGKGGANLKHEVRAVQTQLNAQIMWGSPRQKLAVDGLVGPKTIGAIYDLQKSVLGYPYPDCRVDPNGKTLAALNDPSSESKWARVCIQSPFPVPFSVPVPALSQDKKLSSLWLGVGEAHSGDLVAFGYFNWNARVYRLGASDDKKVEWANLVSHGFKLGGGLGGSGGLVAVFAHGVSKPGEFKAAFSWGNMDFDLALGAKLSSALKSLKGVGKVVDTLEKYKKLNYAGQELVKNRAFEKKGRLHSSHTLCGGGTARVGRTEIRRNHAAPYRNRPIGASCRVCLLASPSSPLTRELSVVWPWMAPSARQLFQTQLVEAVFEET